MATEISQLYASIGADAKEFDNALKRVDSDLSSTQKGFASFQGAITVGFRAIGVAAVTALGLFAAGVTSSVKAAANFEQGVADIGAVMSLASGESQKLEGHIMELGLDPNLKVSATEAKDAIMSLGTAGLSLDQIMGGASEATVLLSNATGGDMASAAALMTDVMSQFNIKAEESSRIVNQLTGLTVASKLSFNDAALAFSQVGGVAAAVGLSLEDTNAILGVTASRFASGSDNATSFKTYLNLLVPSTEDAKNAMIELGLATEDGTSKFFDASGAMVSAEQQAAMLQQAFGGLSDAQRVATLQTIFGRDAMRTAIGLMEGGTPAVTKFKDEVAKVDAGEMASKRMNTFSGALEIARGIVETISISVGQKFLPVLRPLVEQFSTLAQTHGPKLVSFFENLAARMGDGIQKGIEWAQNVLPPLWERMQQVGAAISTVTQAIMRAIKPVTDAIGKYIGWKDALLAVGLLLGGTVLVAIGGFIAAMAPVILLVAKVTAVIVLLRNAWQSNFLGIRDITEDVLTRIGDWLSVHTGVWKGTWGKTLEYFVKHSGEAWGKVRDYFVDMKNKITSDVTHFVAVFLEKVDYWQRRADTIFSVFYNNTTGPIRRWRDDIIEKVKDVLEWFNAHPWIQKGKEIIQGLWDGAVSIWNNFKHWWSGIWRTLTGTVDVKMKIGSPSKEMEKRGAWAVEGFALGAKGAMPMVSDVMGSLANTSMSMGGGYTAPEYAYAGGYGASSPAQPTTSTTRIEQLLTVLIQELRNKQLTANVTVAGGGGGGLASAGGFEAGLRGAR